MNIGRNRAGSILAAPERPQVTSPALLRISALQLSGSITALATPFRADGALDLAAYGRQIERQLAARTAALVVAGSTGEAAALDDDEYQVLLRSAVAQVAGRVPVLAGTGLSATARTIRQTRLARDCGADLALVVTPPYVRPTQAGLLAHYRAVAAEGGLPLLLYNVPGRTGIDLQPETVAALLEQPGIIGIKEANPAPERMQALLGLRRPGFVVFSGDDPTALRALLAGADGVISVASNVVPAAFSRLCTLARRDPAAATALDAALGELYAVLGIEPNPIPVKALLAALTDSADVLRLPLLPLSAVHRPAADAVLRQIRRIEADCLAPGAV
jgi:4-hydroxy-tetrahydrodipicolinate synthase